VVGSAIERLLGGSKESLLVGSFLFFHKLKYKKPNHKINMSIKINEENKEEILLEKISKLENKIKQLKEQKRYGLV